MCCVSSPQNPPIITAFLRFSERWTTCSPRRGSRWTALVELSPSSARRNPTRPGSISTPSSRRTTPSSRRTTRRDFSPRFSPRSPTRALGRRGGSKRSWTKDTATPRRARRRRLPHPVALAASRRPRVPRRAAPATRRHRREAPRGRARGRGGRFVRARVRKRSTPRGGVRDQAGEAGPRVRRAPAGHRGSGTGAADDPTDDPALLGLARMLRFLRAADAFAAREPPRGFSRDATSPRVPSSAFQVELSDALDLRREYVRWIEGKRSFCEFPCVFTTEARRACCAARPTCRSASRSRTRGGPRSAFAGWTGAKRACLSATPTRRSWSS